MLSGLALSNRRVHWSGITDITQWTIGTNLCDIQEFPEGGPVQGVAGAEIGYVVQDRTIRSVQFLPGDTTLIFSFSRVLQDRGSISKYGFTSIGNVLYFVSEDGFYSVAGQHVKAIGQDKVNDWWLDNSDPGRRNVIQCIAGVNKPRIVWVMHSSSGSQMYDRQLIFDWSISRWTKSNVMARVWALLASTGLDLDTTGSEVGDINLDSTAASLDSFGYIGGRPLIGAIDQNGLLCSLTGPNLPATMETAEVHLAKDSRTFVNDAYPFDDVSSVDTGQIAAGTRERLQDPVVWETPVTIEITGSRRAVLKLAAASLSALHPGLRGVEPRAGCAGRRAAGRHRRVKGVAWLTTFGRPGASSLTQAATPMTRAWRSAWTGLQLAAAARPAPALGPPSCLSWQRAPAPSPRRPAPGATGATAS